MEKQYTKRNAIEYKSAGLELDILETIYELITGENIEGKWLTVSFWKFAFERTSGFVDEEKVKEMEERLDGFSDDLIILF